MNNRINDLDELGISIDITAKLAVLAFAACYDKDVIERLFEEIESDVRSKGDGDKYNKAVDKIAGAYKEAILLMKEIKGL